MIPLSRLIGFLAAAAGLGWAAGPARGAAQSPVVPAAPAPSESTAVPVRPVPDLRLLPGGVAMPPVPGSGGFLVHPGENGGPTAVNMTFTMKALLAPETVRLTRFGTTVYGADAGAYRGLALGYLGNLVGLWDERTLWAMMGIGGALGAIWGGTAGAADEGFRTRSGWSVGVSGDRDATP